MAVFISPPALTMLPKYFSICIRTIVNNLFCTPISPKIESLVLFQSGKHVAAVSSTTFLTHLSIYLIYGLFMFLKCIRRPRTRESYCTVGSDFFFQPPHRIACHLCSMMNFGFTFAIIIYDRS